MKLAIIVAAAENNVIGKNNQMLWTLPEDMRFFKNKTWGSPIIMGRKTFEALNSQPLPGRFNIVVSRSSGIPAHYPELQTAVNLREAVELAKKMDAKETFIGGGGQIYQESLPICDTLYVTRINVAPVGDAFFPEIPSSLFRLTASVKVSADEKNAFAMDFQTWEKIKSIPASAG